jgi:hypothetical protein
VHDEALWRFSSGNAGEGKSPRALLISWESRPIVVSVSPGAGADAGQVAPPDCGGKPLDAPRRPDLVPYDGGFYLLCAWGAVVLLAVSSTRSQLTCVTCWQPDGEPRGESGMEGFQNGPYQGMAPRISWFYRSHTDGGGRDLPLAAKTVRPGSTPVRIVL